MSCLSLAALRDQFRTLHREGTFIMPNPFDLGSTRLLTALGFPALATTSSGFAGTLGRLDMTVSRDELVEHVGQMTAATHLPFNVDSERLYGSDAAGIAECVGLLADAGAAGCSIEDWNPATGQIDPFGVAVDRVGAAAEAARSHGIVLTARCENHLHGVTDLDDTINRMRAYREAGAEVAFCPGVVDVASVARVVRAVAIPVNVLLRPIGATVAQYAAVGVRRISIGGAFARLAHGAVVTAAQQLMANGQFDRSGAVDDTLLRSAFTA